VELQPLVRTLWQSDRHRGNPRKEATRCDQINECRFQKLTLVGCYDHQERAFPNAVANTQPPLCCNWLCVVEPAEAGSASNYSIWCKRRKNLVPLALYLTSTSHCALSKRTEWTFGGGTSMGPSEYRILFSVWVRGCALWKFWCGRGGYNGQW